MDQNNIKNLLFTSLLFVIFLISAVLLTMVNNNSSRNRIISNIDKSMNESLVSQNSNDKMIINGKFVGMMEAEFDNKSTKISISEVEN